MGDLTNAALGSGIFSDNEHTVINYLGATFYKACDAVVSSLPDGGASHCVKRIGHASPQHEDFDGRTRDVVVFDFSGMGLEEAIYHAIGQASDIGDNTALGIHLAKALIRRIREFGPIYG